MGRERLHLELRQGGRPAAPCRSRFALHGEFDRRSRASNAFRRVAAERADQLAKDGP